MSRFALAAFIQLVWTNSHGSFVLGLGFLAAKCVVSFVNTRWGKTNASIDASAPPDYRETLYWGLTLLFGVFAAGVLNPFGVMNLVMPFQQVGTSEWIAANPDWLPLLSSTLLHKPLMSARDPKIFLVLLAVLVGSLLRSGRRLVAFHENGISDTIMETLIAITAIALSFRFNRLVFFAAFLITPLLALSVNTAGTALSQRARTVAAAVFSVVALSLFTLFFVHRTAVANLPGNPILPNMSIPGRHMFWNTLYQDALRFLAINNVPGRVFTTSEQAAFFRFHRPELQMFVDGRAQTIHGVDVLRIYRKLLDTEPRSSAAVRQAVAILDGLKVDTVILPYESDMDGLREALLLSNTFSGVYLDAYTIIFMRRGRVGRPLVYADVRTRIAGRTLSALTLRTGPNAAQLQKLTEQAKIRPESWIYWLVARSGLDRQGRIRPNMRLYFAQEAQTLSQADFMRANGANEVVKSLVEIATILESDQTMCKRDGDTVDWGAMAENYAQLYRKLHARFLPF